jgi:hypothetical protein
MNVLKATIFAILLTFFGCTKEYNDVANVDTIDVNSSKKAGESFRLEIDKDGNNDIDLSYININNNGTELN